MILVDSALARREADGKPIRVALIGAGFMGRGITNQIVNSVPGMQLAVIVNRNLEKAERAYRDAGVSEVRRVESAAELDRAIADGVAAITTDHRVASQAARRPARWNTGAMSLWAQSRAASTSFS
jgi:predicted homoserine dehydrogenase-like protein